MCVCVCVCVCVKKTYSKDRHVLEVLELILDLEKNQEDKTFAHFKIKYLLVHISGKCLMKSGHTWKMLKLQPNVSPASKVTCSLKEEIILCLLSRLFSAYSAWF